MSKHQTLLKNVQNLVDNPIIAVGVDDVLSLAPHLERTEAVELIGKTTEASDMQFIGPPLYVRGAEYIYTLRRVEKHVTMHYSGMNKRSEAFCGRNPHLRRREWDYRERAADFAEFNYGDKLVWDQFFQVITYRILEGPKGTVDITAGYKQEVNNMIKYASTDQPMPLLQMLEMHFAAYAVGIRSLEISCGHMPVLASICGTCGGGVVQEVCTVCGKHYHHLSPPCPDWPTPIHSRSVIDDFLHQPAIRAIKHHYRFWAAQDLEIQPFTTTRQHRIIT